MTNRAFGPVTIDRKVPWASYVGRGDGEEDGAVCSCEAAARERGATRLAARAFEPRHETKGSADRYGVR